MPVISGLTDPTLVKLFHMGQTDKQIADTYGISVQAVSARRMRLGLVRKQISRQVNEGLAARWTIHTTQGRGSHHNLHAAKCLKVWLRLRLGDESLSEVQVQQAEGWAAELHQRNEVLCYDPEVPGGWYYRPRKPRDGRLVVDWPKSIPFPDERFKRALELPPDIIETPRKEPRSRLAQEQRAWARSNGYEVKPRGRVPKEIQKAYEGRSL